MDKTTLVSVSLPDPNGRAALQQYVQGVMPLYRDIGGVVVKQSQFDELYAGNLFFTYMLIMDFPSKQALVDLFASEAYQRLVPLRNQAFQKINICFANDM